MRILIDHCLDWRLRRSLSAHEVSATFEMGWAAVKNGKLLALAEAEFDVFLTADRNIRYQQNLRERSLAIIVLVAPSNRLQDTAPLMPQVNALLPTIQPGQIYIVQAEPEPSVE